MWKYIALMAILLTSLQCKNKREVIVDNEGPKVDLPGVDSSVRPDVARGFNFELDGKQIGYYTIKNRNIEAGFTNFGARIVSLIVKDKQGKPVDVVLGLPTIRDYLKSTEPFYGATIGRYCNRIAKARFSLDGNDYVLESDNADYCLHGGPGGFHNRVWEVVDQTPASITFHYNSPDMEAGFPGVLDVVVTYSLTDENSMKIEFAASTDRNTVVNLTNHAFFNLNGEGSGTILDHKVKIFANEITPVDSTIVPTGALMKVKGTPFDFLSFHKIGERIDADDIQLKYGSGYDHNFVLHTGKSDKMVHAATAIGDKSGIQMDVYTTEPGMQFYAGNFMKGENKLSDGSMDNYRTAFCFETQHFPDSPNKPNFPSTELKVGEKYETKTIYKFSIERK